MQTLVAECFEHTMLKQQAPIKIDPTNEEMTISQVIKFFGKYDLQFTKTTIQNYIRIGLLPGPVQKRYYTENHLMILFLIYHLKEGFSLEEIKKVFAPILKDESTFEDDLITPKQLYTIYSVLWEQITRDFFKKAKDSPKDALERLAAHCFKDKGHGALIERFLLVLYTMIQTIVAKKISLALSDNLFD
ncbi:MAG: DUF1836 domain-containing protein [Cellulosilyticaceae bacterium]